MNYLDFDNQRNGYDSFYQPAGQCFKSLEVDVITEPNLTYQDNNQVGFQNRILMNVPDFLSDNNYDACSSVCLRNSYITVAILDPPGDKTSLVFNQKLAIYEGSGGTTTDEATGAYSTIFYDKVRESSMLHSVYVEIFVGPNSIPSGSGLVSFDDHSSNLIRSGYYYRVTSHPIRLNGVNLCNRIELPNLWLGNDECLFLGIEYHMYPADINKQTIASITPVESLDLSKLCKFILFCDVQPVFENNEEQVTSVFKLN